MEVFKHYGQSIKESSLILSEKEFFSIISYLTTQPKPTATLDNSVLKDVLIRGVVNLGGKCGPLGKKQKMILFRFILFLPIDAILIEEYSELGKQPDEDITGHTSDPFSMAFTK